MLYIYCVNARTGAKRAERNIFRTNIVVTGMASTKVALCL